MQQGPLCAEPVEGVACFLESIQISIPEDESSGLRARMGQYSGHVIGTVRDAIKEGFLQWSPRIMLAVYNVDIQASSNTPVNHANFVAEVLGKVYAVVTKRRGRITAEEMREGSPFFIVSATLPVVESFGFAEEIRKRTSGAASPQLIFAGYEILDQDPFWVPQTEEELEDFGDTAERENVAKKYVDGIRTRKVYSI
jgi:ribosome assembly protein 1